MGFLFRNGVWAGIAWQEASFASYTFAKVGFPAAILTMIFICLANTIFAAWFKGELR